MNVILRLGGWLGLMMCAWLAAVPASSQEAVDRHERLAPTASPGRAPAASPDPSAPAAPPQAQSPPASGAAPVNGAPAQQPSTAPSPGSAPAATAAGSPAPPQLAASGLPTSEISALLKPVAALGSEIDAAEKSYERIRERDADLVALRESLDALIGKALRARENLLPALADARSQLQRLGETPKPGEPAEAPAVAQERSRLNTLTTTLDGAIKSCGLIEVRAKQLIARAQDARRQIFARALFAQHTSPLKPSVWTNIAAQAAGAGEQIAAIAGDWWSRARTVKVGLALLAFATLLLWMVLHLLSLRFIRRYAPEPAPSYPYFLTRARTSGWVAFALAVPTAFATLLFYIGLEGLDLLYLQSRSVGSVALRGVLVFTGVYALSHAILSPARPSWRLFHLADAPSRRLSLLVQGIAAVHAIDLLLDQTIRDLYLPIEVNVGETFLANLAFATLLLGIVGTRLTVWRRTSPPPTERARLRRPIWFKLPLLIVALAIFVASLLGYVALGRFIATQVLVTSVALLTVLLLHLGIEAIAPVRSRSEDALAVAAGKDPAADRESDPRQIVTRGLGIFLNVLLAVAAAPLLLLSWGFALPDILAWLKAAFFGFEIGEFRISLARILIAAGLFVLLVSATRLGQRWLSSTVLQPPRVDSGLANSIHTVLGYVGFAVAVLAAVSYAGFDITNLAIVAGALSVGIGFGLQSIVNNFVSGLILLVERPVKVGDWIVVGANEGYVRKISVRSTEIETFDRSSVIVPNAELITGTVTNWTHHNAMGRVIIKVGVAYDSDPEHVTEILMSVARNSEIVLPQPPPFVVFEDFGASSLDFSLRAYVANVNRALSAKTELRMAIFKAFKAEGIEIPFPQQDLHLRDLDTVRKVVSAALEERQRQRTAQERQET